MVSQKWGKGDTLIEAKITQIIEDMLNELGFSLVRVQFLGGQSGRNQLQIMTEPTEDREMTIEAVSYTHLTLPTKLEV